MGNPFLRLHYRNRTDVNPVAREVIDAVSEVVFPVYHAPTGPRGLVLADRNVEDKRDMLAIVGPDLLHYLGEQGLIDLEEMKATLCTVSGAEITDGAEALNG